MSGGFAKLDGGIVDSTLWMQPHDVLRVWIAMLAKCDSYGIVKASVPAMAHLCMVPIERLEQILTILTSPDPYSRTPDEDGRRLRTVEGGWLILNYVKYRELVQTKAQSHAERQRKYRERLNERDRRVTSDASVTQSVTSDAEAEAEAKAEKKQDQELVPHSAKSRAARLPKDWQPTDELLRWAEDARPDVDAKTEAEKFRDYWHAKAGRDACKADWPATWRNWIRNSRGSKNANGRQGGSTGHESVAERAARFAREGDEADARRAAANRGDAAFVGADGSDLRAPLG